MDQTLLNSLEKIHRDDTLKKEIYKGNYKYSDSILMQKYIDKTPKIFWVLDTEDDSRGNIELCVIKSNEGEIEIFKNNSPGQLRTNVQEYILSKKIKLIFAHNLQYDLNSIFGIEYLNHNPVFRQASVLQTKWKNNGHATIFRDSTAILPAKLKTIGEKIGVKKIDSKGKFNDIDYCVRDCDILIIAIERFFETLRKNTIPYKLTLPAIFLSYFSQISNRNYTRIPEILDYCRQTYKGGRCEIFKMGIQKNVNIYDFNSLYPAVMQTEKFPDPKTAVKTKKLEPSKNKFQILDCLVSIDTYLPLLCIKYNKKLVFPNGTFRGFFTNYEIETIENSGQGKLLKVYSGLSFQWLGKIFKTIIEKLYALRQNSSGYEQYIFKIIMNGGYGKFGQGKEIFEYDGEFLTQIIKDKYPFQTNYIWAIHTTAKARLKLWELMCEHKKELAYVDTDSIHLVNNGVVKTKNISNKLGALKHEGFFPEAEYKGAKMYRLTDATGKITYKVKGVPAEMPGSDRNLQKEFFETGKTTFRKPVKIRSFLRDKRKILNYWEHIEKQLRVEYDKRKVLDFGNTIPLVLDYHDELLTEYYREELKWQTPKNSLLTNRNRCTICKRFVSDILEFCEIHDPINYEQSSILF